MVPDCMIALEHCAKEDCAHCPFESGCQSATWTWVTDEVLDLFDQLAPDPELLYLQDLILRCYNCEEGLCNTTCPVYAECGEEHHAEFMQRLYDYLQKKVNSCPAST